MFPELPTEPDYDGAMAALKKLDRYRLLIVGF